MRNASEYTLASSVQAGFDTCPKCSAPPADLLNAQDVVWCDAAQLYHTSDECTDFSGKATLHTLTDAQKDGFEACPLCGAAGRAAETSDR